MVIFRLGCCWFLFLWLSSSWAQQAQMSSSEIYSQLLSLKETTSVLYIAAHPDDENTRLLTWLAKGKHYRTAYLSLTRGDGGQNLIGDEQGDELGMIRTQELLGARNVDGTNQFFTRAVDFGYSKSADEAFELWNYDSVLADVVWVIRQFRPDVIITRFPPDERAGHGHHTASAQLAIDAFETAGNPDSFSEQLVWCEPWQPVRLFWNASAWWDKTLPDRVDQKTLFELEVGGYDPLLGMGYGELGGLARSQHRSQGFGVSPYRGEQFEYLQLLKGSMPPDISDPLYVPAKWSTWHDGPAILAMIESLLKDFYFLNPDSQISELIQLYANLNSSSSPPERIYKRDLMSDVMAAALGLWAEPVVKQISPDGKLQVVHELVKGSSYPVNLRLIGWMTPDVLLSDVPLMNRQPFPGKDWEAYSYELENNIIFRDTILLSVQPGANTVPYWLKNPYLNFYSVPDQAVRGRPEFDELPTCLYVFEIEGLDFVLARKLVQKTIDPAKGELYEPVVVYPPASIDAGESVFIAKPGSPNPLIVQVTSLYPSGITGFLKLEIPHGWTVKPDSFQVEIEGNSSASFTFMVTPADKEETTYITPYLMTNEGKFHHQKREVLYDHIPAQRWMKPSSVKALVLSRTLSDFKIGYIEGAGDLVDESLRAAGLDVTPIALTDITLDDLKKFDAVVTGVRAYNVHETLEAANPQLMEYVHQGGTLIVQYNTVSNFTSGKNPDGNRLGPYPFTIGRQRTTNQNSDVSFLLPDHPVLKGLTLSDFEDWVQERGLYYAADPDPAYQMPLSFTDPNEQEARGALIYGNYGEGVYIYTGISFFRQLPAGVPGAYRLFFNMLEAGK